MTSSDLTDAWAPRLLSVLRIMTGLQFLEHGTQKFLSFPLRAAAAPELTSLLGVQGCLEIVGGVLIILGLFTRPVAFILAGDMAVAYFMVALPKELLSRPERWRRGYFVLLRLPLFGRGRRWRLEY